LQSWYQRLIPGLGDRPSEVARNIAALAGTLFPGRRIVALGNSIGGYAALTFGCLCGFDKVLAFCPQTFISPELRFEHDDCRWVEQMHAIEFADYSGTAQFMSRSNRPEIHVYVGEDSRLDLLHAQRLAGTENVTVHLAWNTTAA
jgi:hypothetical protein